MRVDRQPAQTVHHLSAEGVESRSEVSLATLVVNEEVQRLVEARVAARAEKNWAEADRIRDDLEKMGIQLMDAKDPDTGELKTTWEVKR